MCFSTEASFVGGAVILSIGVATVRKIHKPSHLLFALIPIFFGIQQITEGFLWLSLPKPEYIGLQKFSTYVFLIMADVLWPIMIPLSVLFMEENKKKKRILWIFLVTGILLSSYYFLCIILFDVNPQIMHYHIQYKNNFPKTFAILAFIIYLIVTIPPLFISSVKRMYMFGISLFLSCLITAIFFTQYLTSVWCFFAALISGIIFWILNDSKIKHKTEDCKK